VFSVGVEHLLLLRKGKLMLPLRQNQKERPKLPLLLDGELPPLLLLDGGLPPLEELEKLPPLDGGLPLLGVKLNGDVENKRLPVKEPQLLEGEPNRELPLIVHGEFVEGLVEFVELLGELENLDSVGLDVGLNELSDVGVGVVERLGVDVDAVERLGVGVAAAVSLPRHL
jgi:hypothetical protein